MSDALSSIFISYAHADSPFVDQLEADLRSKGWTLWVDRRSLAGGQRWHRELQDGIDRAQAVLVVLSPDSVASEYVQAEYSYAIEEGKLVIPLYYRPCKVPLELRTIQWIDFQQSYEQGLAALLQTLERCENGMTSALSSADIRPGESEQLPSQPPPDVLPQPAPAPRQPLAPLVGRQREWSQLQQLWQRRASGGPQLVVLSGEAGIGKTRLAEELFNWVVQQSRSTARAACYAVEREVAYAPVGLWLRAQAIRARLSSLPVLWLSEVARFVPELLVERPTLPPPGPLSESWQQQRLLEALARAVLVARPPLLLLLDDLQWCDRETLNWLHYLLRFDPQAHLLLVATLRTEEVTKDHPVQALLAALQREGLLTQLNLEGLSAAETASLAAQTAGRELDAQRVSQLYSETEGNALFVVETVRMGLEGANGAGQGNGAPGEPETVGATALPPTIQAVISTRLEQLSPQTRELVSVASVIGRAFSVELLAQASKQEEDAVLDALDELWQRGIVREAEPQGYDFRHAKIREVAYADLPPPRRRLLHRRVAQAFEVVYADRLNSVSGQLALHYEQAGDWAKTLQYAQQAGEQAQRVYDPRAAIEQYNRALDAAQKGSIIPPVTLYGLRGQAYETLGNFERARADYENLLQLARSSGDRQGEWQALINLGFLWTGRDYNQAESFYQQALERARSMDNPVLLAQSLNRLGNWYLNVEQPHEALQYHQEALTLFQKAQNQRGIAETLDLLGMASYLGGDLLQGTAYYHQAVVLFGELGDRKGLTSSLGTLALRGPTFHTDTLVSAASLAEALQDTEQALKIAREIGHRSAEAYALYQVALCLGSRGEYGRALAAAKQSLDVAEEIEHRQWQTAAHTVLGGIYSSLLAYSQAREHFEQALALAQEIGSLFWTRMVTGYLASVAILLHDFAKTENVLSIALRPDTPAQTLPQRMGWCAAAELALAQGNSTRALEILDQLVSATINASEGKSSLRVSKLRGETLATLQRPEEAEAALTAAQALAAALGARPMQWRIGVSLGTLYQTQGRSPEAEQAFATARTLIEELSTTIEEGPLKDNFLHQATAMLPQTHLPSPKHADK